MIAPTKIDRNRGCNYWRDPIPNDEVVNVITSQRLRFLLLTLFSFIAMPIAAQSPNTASMIVDVVDQNDAVVKDAKISVVNSATGDTRDVFTGTDGMATIPGLSLTGTYAVTVSKDGFGSEERKDITLRSGETATLTGYGLTGTRLTTRRDSPSRSRMISS